VVDVMVKILIFNVFKAMEKSAFLPLIGLIGYSPQKVHVKIT